MLPDGTDLRQRRLRHRPVEVQQGHILLAARTAAALHAGRARAPRYDARDLDGCLSVSMGIRERLVAMDRFQHERPWLAFPVAVVKKFRDDQASSLAALIAYYGFFSLFPLLLVLASVAGWVLGSDPALRDRLVESALSQFPIIGSRIGSSVRPLRGSSAAVIVGMGGAIWSGLAAVSAAQDAMDDVWEVPRRVRASFLRSRLRGLLMLSFLGSFVVVIAAVSATASALGTGWLARTAIVFAFVVLNAGALMIAYRILTSADLSVGDVAPGALFAGIAWTILQGIGGWLVESRIRGAGDVYGFFAVVIGLLAWIYLAAQVFLIGAEMCVVRARRLWPRMLSRPPAVPHTAPKGSQNRDRGRR